MSIQRYILSLIHIYLMCCFNTSSRKRLIDDMKSVTLNDMDGEIAELMYKTVRKLEMCIRDRPYINEDEEPQIAEDAETDGDDN